MDLSFSLTIRFQILVQLHHLRIVSGLEGFHLRAGCCNLPGARTPTRRPLLFLVRLPETPDRFATSTLLRLP